jgi:CRP/FNR family cyclic AMP-dependent transcriptional regulator
MSEENHQKSGNQLTGAVRQQLTDGRHVFRQHEIGDAAYIVLDGTISIYRESLYGLHNLATLGKGAIFGEMALIDDKPRMASAKVIGGPATLMVVTRDVFKRRLEALDPFTRGLIHVLAETARSTQKN